MHAQRLPSAVKILLQKESFMKTLLVTGGAGFIGANFVHYWVAQYPNDKVIVIDALTYAGNMANLEPVKDHDNFTFVHGDICDTALVEKLLREHQVDTLVHFAAESHVDRSITGPDAFIETNILGTYSLLKAAKTVWLDGEKVLPHRFHHVSTDEVYGDLATAAAPAFTEETPYAPSSPYAASKAASDHLVRAWHRTYGLPVIITNCSNNYGPWQHAEKLIPNTISKALSGQPIPVYGNGEQIRDWLYVEDHVQALWQVLNCAEVGQSYNIGGHNEQKNIEVVKAICELMDEFSPMHQRGYPLNTKHSSLITYVQDRPGHDVRYAINSSKIQAALNWQPQHNFIAGLRRTVQWYLQQPGFAR